MAALSAQPPPPQASGAPSRPPALLLTRDVVNNFRFQLAVMLKGQRVLVQAFRWNYQGGSSVKDFLMQKFGTNKKMKEIFNKDQRDVLDSGKPCEEYDISLLNILFQHACGTAGSATDAAGQSLGQLVHKLKQERNDISHANGILPMSDGDLQAKLVRLGDLLCSITRLAGSHSGTQSDVIDDLVSEIQDDFKELMMKIREPLSTNDYSMLPQLQQEIKLFQNVLQHQVEQDSRLELESVYSQMWDVALVQWLYPDQTIRPSINFTNLVIKEDTSSSMPSQQHQPRFISHEDILEVRRRDGGLPDVLIISADGGMGKTTLLKYMMEKWVTDPSPFKGLQEVSPLLYLQLRGSTIGSWQELLENLLGKTLEDSRLMVCDFVKMFLKMKTVVLLDGFDEGNKKSKKLIKELVNLVGNFRIVITTRPETLDPLTQIVRAKKKGMSLEVKGIRREDRPFFVQNTLNCIVQDPDAVNELKGQILEKLDSLQLGNYDLDVPLTLVLLIILEVEVPERSSSNSGLITEIFSELTKLMIGKCEERLTLKDVDDAVDKIIEYHEFLEELAFRGLTRNEHDLLPASVAALKAKCKELELPDKELFSGFFSSKRTRRGLQTILIWSYPHNRFQEHWAGSYVMKRLLHLPRRLPDLSWLLDLETVTGLMEANVTPEELQQNPVLNIILDGDESNVAKISTHRNIQNVLCCVTGLLADPCPDSIVDVETRLDLLDHLIPALLRLVNFGLTFKNFFSDFSAPKCNYFDAVYRHMIESRWQESVVDACVRILRKHETWSTNGDAFQGLQLVLEHVTPDRLSINMEMIHMPPQLLPALEMFAKKEMKIDLYLVQHFISGSGSSDAYLKTLRQSESSCNLVELYGKLSVDGIQLLPSSLKVLLVRIDWDGLRSLLSTLPQLQNLNVFQIALEDQGARPSLESLDQLSFSGKELSLRSPYPLPEADVGWWFQVAKRLLPSGREYDIFIVYPETRRAAEEAMKAFSHQGALAEMFYVTAASPFSEGDLDDLKRLAAFLGIWAHFE
ncbi:uncharacterized protein LOC119598645 [Penaeus monodon]|uniref:uncharacterized protein LOC119598645 n=1 Tax=Penaeus monodon TaxID=6687 RepID=UPI0018A7135F|nr:uncharacterized protein LOC119598645 [Penaeus monodon]